MNFKTVLEKSAMHHSNILCFGLQPMREVFSNVLYFGADLLDFYEDLLGEAKANELIPAAFELDLAHFLALNEPTTYSSIGNFGQELMIDLLELLREEFPNKPIILNANLSGFVESMKKYAELFYSKFEFDAITLSPYFDTTVLNTLKKYLCKDKGAYIVIRSSGHGADAIQLLNVGNQPLYMVVAKNLPIKEFSGVGFGVTATDIQALQQLASEFPDTPLLIHNLDYNIANVDRVMKALKQSRYKIELARISSFSYLTHPWYPGSDKPASDWLDTCLGNLEELIRKTGI